MAFKPADSIQDLQYFGEFGGVNPSISDSSTYTFLSAKTMFDTFEGNAEGCYLYSRHSSPSNLYLDKALAAMEAAAAPAVSRTPDTAQQRRMREMQAQRSGPQRVMNLLKAMAIEEGAVAMLTTATRNHDGTIFAQGGGSYKGTDPANFLDLAMSVEDYNTFLRLAKAGTTVKADLEVKTKFHTKDLQGYNVLAEIPGTDPMLKDEVVMIGAHLDSWQSGTGATDNASGSAVMIEAMRIIKAAGIDPRRTIRIGLWSAEEQGLLGAYFMANKAKKENWKIEAVLNNDIMGSNNSN